MSFPRLVIPIKKRHAGDFVVVEPRITHTRQALYSPFRHPAMLIMLVVTMVLAWWPDGPIHAQSLAPQATTITITQWLDVPDDPGARQSTQSPYNAIWYVEVNVTTLNGENIRDLAGGTVTFLYDGQWSGTFHNPEGPMSISMAPKEVGDHLFQANFTGDSSYGASSAQATHTVTKADVGLTIDSTSTFTYAPNEPLKLIARSNVGIPAGEVLKFLINGSLVFSFTIPAGIGAVPVPIYVINEANYPPVPVKAPSTAGTYRLSIAYGGDTNILAGASPGYQIHVTATGAPTPLPTTTNQATPTPAIAIHSGTPTASPFPQAGVTPIPIVAASSTPPSSVSSPKKQSGASWWWILVILGIGSVGGVGMVWRTKLKQSKRTAV